MLVFLGLHFIRQILKRGVRLIQIEGQLGGFALEHTEAARHGAAQVRDHLGA